LTNQVTSGRSFSDGIAWVQQRVHEYEQILEQLLAASKLPFNSELHSRLPSDHGLYVIYQKDAAEGQVLRAGRTKTAEGGLRQRIYRDHLMGNQKAISARSS
jgi:hypothetical protein